MGKGFLSRFTGKKENNRLCSDTGILVERILKGQLSDIKISAALVCLKHNRSPRIYRKALDVLDRFNRIDTEVKESIEISYPYRRKNFSPYILIGSAVVLSLLPDSGVKTVFHGENMPQPTTKDVFDYLDISTLSTEDSLSMLKNLNIGFFNRKLFLPEISALGHIRLELNINDIFTVLERFHNPVGSDYCLLAVRSEREVDFYRELLDGRYRRFGILLEREPYPDAINPTRLYIYGDREEVVNIDFPDSTVRPFMYRKFDLNRHVDFIKHLLSGELKEYRHLLFVNGAILLYLAGRTKGIQEGYEITRELFESYDYSQILRNIQRYTDYLNYKNIYEL
ncbi:hypothetical protein [Persephonella sp.]|nr:hypothetical protein [Aquificota bacterium]